MDEDESNYDDNSDDGSRSPRSPGGGAAKEEVTPGRAAKEPPRQKLRRCLGACCSRLRRLCRCPKFRCCVYTMPCCYCFIPDQMIRKEVLIARLRSAGTGKQVSMALVEETLTADRERMAAFKKKWRSRCRMCYCSCCLLLLGGFATLLVLFATSSWTCLCEDCGWPPRVDFGAAVRPDGSFFLVAGRDDFQNFGDVWTGDQEGNWRRLVDTGPFRPRHGHALLCTSSGELLLLGGDEGGIPPAVSLLKSDVWRSPDGETWVLQTGAAPWSARKYFGAVTDGAEGIFIAGGLGGSDSGGFNDVWQSQDQGATWQAVLLAAPWNGRHSFGFVRAPGGLQEGSIVETRSLYLLGGFDGFAHHDVWLGTPDGIGWTLQRFTHRRESRYDVVEERATWEPRQSMGAVADATGRVKVFGGRLDIEAAEGFFSREVWELPPLEAAPTDWWAKRTNDARLNVRTTPPEWIAGATPPWSARAGHRAVFDLANNAVYVLGGEDRNGFKADMWKEAFSLNFVNFYSTIELAVLQVIETL